MRFHLLLPVFIALSLRLSAQTGIVSGIVKDADNNQPLVGATVSVENTQAGSVTDLDGKFEINGLPAGNYILKLSYLGYESKEIENVQVTEKQNTPVTITLTANKAGNTLNEVVIKTEARRENLGSLLIIRKNSAVVSDAISADMIRRSPDKNTSDVLKRISGVTVQDNKFVIIRGMNDRYNEAMLNGTQLPSSEADRKTFAFDIFPANMIDNITIVKSTTPDLPGDFSGGLIQVNTKEIPDQNFLFVKGGGSYNSISTFQNYYSSPQGSKDWIGVDDGNRDIPAEFPSHNAFLKLGDDGKIAAAALLPNSWHYSLENSSPLNPSLQLSGGFITGKKDRKFGGILGATYYSTRSFAPISRADYYGAKTAGNDTIYHYKDSSYQRTILASALANFAFKLNGSNKFYFNNLYSINSLNQTVLRNGYSNVQGYYIQSNAFYFSSNTILNMQLGGEHFIGKAKLRIKWNGYYTNLNRDEPDYRRNLYESDDPTRPYFCPITATTSTNIGAGLRYYGNITDHSKGANVDLELPFQLFSNPQTVKFGGAYYYDQRNRDVRVFSIGISDPGNFNYNLYYASQDTIFSPAHFNKATGFTLNEDNTPTNHYDGSIQNASAYLMLDNKFTDKIRLVWGLRLENYHNILNTFDQSDKPYRVDTAYLDLLPSANLIFSIRENANIRASASRSIARPSYRELANAPFYDFLQNITFYGNPKLVETHITNLEIRWEQYFPGSQYYSLSLFYKDFTNPIEQNLFLPGSDSRSVQFVNVSKANNLGVEMEGRKNFGFLGRGWDNLVAYINLALIESKVFVRGKTSDTSANRPLEGQSPYVINASLQYTAPKTGLGISLLFNTIGERLYLVGSVSDAPIWQQIHPQLDLKVSKSILKNGLIEVTWGDILHGNDLLYENFNEDRAYQPTAGSYQYQDRVVALQHYGYNLSLAISYKF